MLLLPLLWIKRGHQMYSSKPLELQAVGATAAEMNL
jgi:hypothetical protein